MMELPFTQLSKVPRRIKVIEESFASTDTGLILKRIFAILLQIIRFNNQNANASSQRSPIAEEQANSAESVLTPSSLSKTKVFPLDHVQPERPFSASLIPKNNEASSQNSPE
jgi:hypothetical protein